MGIGQNILREIKEDGDVIKDPPLNELLKNIKKTKSMAKKNETVAEAADGAGKKTVEKAATLKKNKFDLASYKKEKGYDNTGFKPTEYLKVSPAFGVATGVPGPAIGHVNVVRGHSNTSKTTFMLEAAVDAQKKGILPVFLVTEMKWSWEHLKMLGFEFEMIPDGHGGMKPDGFFLYMDMPRLKTIEDVANEILSLIKEQEEGRLKFDLLFVWDSVGSIRCLKSLNSESGNNQFDAGAMSQQFVGKVNQKIVSSRKNSYPYNNTALFSNKTWVRIPTSPMGQPKLESKCGNALFSDSSFVFTFGGVASSGVYPVFAERAGKKIRFASKVNVQVEKNHVTGISTSGMVICTSQGYIEDSKPALDKYKKDNMKYLLTLMGTNDSNANADEIKTSIDDREESLASDTTIFSPEEV